jgi:hypothetical protein
MGLGLGLYLGLYLGLGLSMGVGECLGFLGLGPGQRYKHEDDH